MPPICGLPFKVNLNYFHSDLNYLFTEHFASNFFIRLSEIEQAYNEVFQIEYKDVLSMLNLEPNYIFEFVQKVYPNVFMGVPKPAEIPGFIKKGIMDMKYQPNLFFNQHAIEDGWATPTSQHRRTPAPIIEEVESDSSQYTRGETSSSREYYNKIEYDMHVDNSSDVTNTQEIKEPKSTISFQPKKVIIKNL